MLSQKTSFINGKIIINKFDSKYTWERMRIAVLNSAPAGKRSRAVAPAKADGTPPTGENYPLPG